MILILYFMIYALSKKVYTSTKNTTPMKDYFFRTDTISNHAPARGATLTSGNWKSV